MSNFADSPTFSNHNDYYTPKSAWEIVAPYVRRRGFNKVYEPCLLNSNEQSKKYLEELGFNVLGNKNHNFLTDENVNPIDYQIIWTNPPFERIKSYNQRHDNLKYKILKKIIDTKKPFIIILNSTNIFQKWFKELFENINDIKFIFPSKKIQYEKYKEGGVEKLESGSGASFNSVFITHKLLDRNIWV